MTPTPPYKQRSLAGQVLNELLNMASGLGAIRAEMRTKHQWQTDRLTRLEQRMDMLPPRTGMPPQPASSSLDSTPVQRLLSFARLISTGQALWRLARLVPWGLLSGAASLMGAAAWNWLWPIIRRVLLWLAT